MINRKILVASVLVLAAASAKADVGGCTPPEGGINVPCVISKEYVYYVDDYTKGVAFSQTTKMTMPYVILDFRRHRAALNQLDAIRVLFFCDPDRSSPNFSFLMFNGQSSSDDSIHQPTKGTIMWTLGTWACGSDLPLNQTKLLEIK